MNQQGADLQFLIKLLLYEFDSLADPEEQQQKDDPEIIINLAAGGPGDQADQDDADGEAEDIAVLAGEQREHGQGDQVNLEAIRSLLEVLTRWSCRRDESRILRIWQIWHETSGPRPGWRILRQITKLWRP